MTPEEFSYLSKLLKDRSGLVVGEDKRYLIESRLGPIVKEQGLDGLSALVARLKSPAAEALRKDVTEAMTTNESFFFRDKTPFDNFKNVMLPELLETRKTRKRLRIWSAAASTGQEAYSLALTIRELGAKLAGWRIEILGTDLSSEAIDQAKRGAYTQFEVQRGMPAPLMVKFFKQVGREWLIDPGLKTGIQFRVFNLLDDYRSLGQFDIVFCRNVLIYFDRDTKADILARLARQMAPDSFMVLGAAETVVGLSDAFKADPAARGLYRNIAIDARPAMPGALALRRLPAATGLSSRQG